MLNVLATNVFPITSKELSLVAIIQFVLMDSYAKIIFVFLEDTDYYLYLLFFLLFLLLNHYLIRSLIGKANLRYILLIFKYFSIKLIPI